MELSLTAPVDGRVREVLVSANSHVTAGRPLLRIEPLEDAPAPAAGERAALRRRRGHGADGLERLAWLVLGYDVPDRRRAAHRRRPDRRAGGPRAASTGCSRSTPTCAR